MARKDRAKPTHYPVLPFHIIRSVQLVSAIIVASIMLYFLKELQHDHYTLPWTFILLLAVSLLTILFLTATILLHIFYGLNPLLNTILNSLLTTLWVLSFALLARWSSGTLAHVCNRDNWDSSTGIMICRIYKTLFSFTLFGFLSTVLALGLDLHTQRGVTRRGKFTALQQLDNKRAFDAPDGVLALEGEEANPNPTAGRSQRQTQRGGDGYAVPDEQYIYNEDTAYQGAAGQVERRSVEGRL